MAMACQSGYLFHLGVLPDVYLVLRVAVGAHDLIHSPAEHQVADL